MTDTPHRTDRWLNASQIADLLGYPDTPAGHRAANMRLTRAGVPKVKDGRSTRWWESDVLGYMRKVASGQPVDEHEPVPAGDVDDFPYPSAS